MKIGPVVRVPVVTSNLVIHCQARLAAKDVKKSCPRSLICMAEVTSGGRIEGEYGTSVMPGKDETTAQDHENGAGENSDSKASDPESSKPDVTSGGRIEGNYRTSAMPGKDDTTAVDHGNVSQMTDETKIVRPITLHFACILLSLLTLSLLSTHAFPLCVFCILISLYVLSLFSSSFSCALQHAVLIFNALRFARYVMLMWSWVLEWYKWIGRDYKDDFLVLCAVYFVCWMAMYMC